jgi:mitochondrial chaperone BCS1
MVFHRVLGAWAAPGWGGIVPVVHAGEEPVASAAAAAGDGAAAAAPAALAPSGAAATDPGGAAAAGVSAVLAPLLPAAVADNQFFTGGLGLAALGFAASFATRASNIAGTLARRYLLITLEVTSKDPAYPWVLSWLRAHGSPQLLSVQTNIAKRADGSAKPLFEFVPGPGKHLVRYDGRLFFVDRAREQQSVALADGKPWEKVTLTAVGRDVNVFDKLLGEAQHMAAGTTEGMTVIYTAWGSEWRPFGHPRPRRHISSVHLADSVSEEIVQDLTEWRDSMAWYHERGIPYRRGYLLHGPPGCGKSSFIYALAGHLQYDICMLSLNSEGLTDDRLELALSNVPQQAIVLLEDIDAAFTQRAAADGRSSVSFSGLLNAIDGVAAGEQRV